MSAGNCCLLQSCRGWRFVVYAEKMNTSDLSVTVTPEQKIKEYQDTFNIITSKAIVLLGYLSEDEVEGRTSGKGRKRTSAAQNEELETVDSAVLLQLKQQMFNNYTRTKILDYCYKPPNPRVDSPLLCIVFKDIKASLQIVAIQNKKLVDLSTDLHDAHMGLLKAQAECDSAKLKLKEKLQFHSEEIDTLKASPEFGTTLDIQKDITTKLRRTNFIRMLLVLLVSHKDINLVKKPEFETLLTEFSVPLTFRDLTEKK